MKKNKLYFLPLLFISVLFVFYSCKKDNKYLKNVVHSSIVANDVIVDDASNISNPYDSVGVVHNLVLEATRSIWHTENANTEGVYNEMIDYLTSNGFSTNSITYSAVMNSVSYTMNDTNYSASIIDADTNLSSTAKIYLTNMIIMLKIGNVDTTFEGFIAHISSIENDILYDSSLSSYEKEVLLSTASVERHSLLYWIRESNGDNGHEGGNPCSRPSWLNNLWNWMVGHQREIKIALSDTLGALELGIAGAILNSAIAGLP